MKLETAVVHAARSPDTATGATVAPIHFATTFERDPDGQYRRGYVYGRNGTPNRTQLEDCLSQLEGGADCAAFASGSAATNAVFQSLSPGDQVIAPTLMYHGTRALLDGPLRRWGLVTTYVDLTNPEALAAAVGPKTSLVWVETPSNPTLRLTDIRATVSVANAAGAVVVCDNTWATPICQRPLELGADLVVHATTKYLRGHSDVLGGAVITADAKTPLFRAVRSLQSTAGAVPSPLDCWLVRSGVQTLALRVKRQSENAMAVAQFLAAHPRVTVVHYPGLSSHPHHQLARDQSPGFGAMLSFEVESDADRPAATAIAVAARVQLFTRATSLGGLESTLEHRASIEGFGSNTPQALLRVSVGIEHSDDLIADLAQALRP